MSGSKRGQRKEFSPLLRLSLPSRAWAAHPAKGHQVGDCPGGCPSNMLSGAAEPGVINHTRESRYQVPAPQLGAYHENAFSEAHAMGSTPWSQSHPQPQGLLSIPPSLRPPIWLCLGLVTVPHFSYSTLQLNLGQGPQPARLSMQPQLKPADCVHPFCRRSTSSRLGAPRMQGLHFSSPCSWAPGWLGRLRIQTLHFCSSHGLRAMRLTAMLGSALSGEPALEISLSLCLPSLSL